MMGKCLMCGVSATQELASTSKRNERSQLTLTSQQREGRHVLGFQWQLGRSPQNKCQNDLDDQT